MIAAEAATALPQTRFLQDLSGTLQPEVAVGRIVRGIDRNKKFIVPSLRAKMFLGTARHFPTLFDKTTELLLRRPCPYRFSTGQPQWGLS